MVYRPISGVLIFLCIMSLLWPLFAAWRSKQKEAKVTELTGSKAERDVRDA
jgi:TctA family transporter